MSQQNPSQNMTGTSRDVLPASQYLQERLQERRARHARPRRSRHTDFGPQKARDDDIFLNEAEETRATRMYDSSPLAASSGKPSEPGSAHRRRALGLRDMDHQLDRLSKQNFALKLELDHRREQAKKLQEQIGTMQAQVERAELLEDEHKELLRINSQMVDELERRDKAVEEAMDIICELEEKLAEAEERTSNTRPSTANADSGYAGTESQERELSSSPPPYRPSTPQVDVQPPSQAASSASQRLQGVLSGPTPAKTRREPLILSQQRPSTNALRSVYLESARQLHPVKSFQSLLSKQEVKAEDDDAPSSPRLSVLSESSFPSLYSPKPQVNADRFPWEAAESRDENGMDSASRTHQRQDSMKRVSQWISERDTAVMTPSKSNNLSTPLLDDGVDVEPSVLPSRGASNAHYQSLNNALESVAGRRGGTPRQLEPFNPFESRPRKQRSTQSRPTSFAGPIFGEPLLPPTPESASTRMLRASRSSIADDRSLTDATPAATKGSNPLQPSVESGFRTAPRQMRSSVELRTALASNMEFRSQVLDGLREMQVLVHPEDEDEAALAAVEGYAFEEDDFPDGKSIHMGTPRRLLKRARPPVSNQPSSGEAAKKETAILQSPPRRRRSSDQYVGNSTKPRLSRVETSPMAFGLLGSMSSSSKKLSAESITSPHSVHSNSSGGRTIVQAEESQRRALSSESSNTIPPREPVVASPLRGHASPLPVRTLSQKTATLFRRLSASHGSDHDRGSTPALASGSVVSTPFEIKRPRTSNGQERASPNPGVSSTARPPSSRGHASRPSLQLRTKTEPAAASPLSSSATDKSAQGSEKDKKGFFKRANSVKTPEVTDEIGGKSGPGKRRGSLRDAVTTARRPWR